MTWNYLDEQMRRYRSQLSSLARIDEWTTRKLATTIASEVRFLAPEAKNRIKAVSPVKLQDRLDELTAFQAFMDNMSTYRNQKVGALPELVRAQVIVQNYITFVYLPEACFSVLRKEMPKDSTTRKCAKYLTDNPVRSFRNAMAHANWSYNEDFSGLVYWARKGSDPGEPLARHEVDQKTLGFWQSLSRCTAYAAMSNL